MVPCWCRGGTLLMRRWTNHPPLSTCVELSAPSFEWIATPDLLSPHLPPEDWYFQWVDHNRTLTPYSLYCIRLSTMASRSRSNETTLQSVSKYTSTGLNLRMPLTKNPVERFDDAGFISNQIRKNEQQAYSSNR